MAIISSSAPVFSSILKRCSRLKKGGTIFGYLVKDPQRYGVVEFDADNNAVGIVEKPKNPPSKYAVPGLYFYDNDVIRIAEQVKLRLEANLRSPMFNMEYLRQGKLRVEPLAAAFAGSTPVRTSPCKQASNFVQAVQERQGLKIACIEEIAYQLGYINADELASLSADMLKNQYGKYLMDIITENNKDNAFDNGMH